MHLSHKILKNNSKEKFHTTRISVVKSNKHGDAKKKTISRLVAKSNSVMTVRAQASTTLLEFILFRGACAKLYSTRNKTKNHEKKSVNKNRNHDLYNIK
jgi:hypothetical protein